MNKVEKIKDLLENLDFYEKLTKVMEKGNKKKITRHVKEDDIGSGKSKTDS